IGGNFDARLRTRYGEVNMKIDILANRQCNARGLVNREAALIDGHAVLFRRDQGRGRKHALVVCIDVASAAFGFIGNYYGSTRYGGLRRVLTYAGNPPEPGGGPPT